MQVSHRTDACVRSCLEHLKVQAYILEPTPFCLELCMTFFGGWEGNDAGKYLKKALLPFLSGFLGGEDTSRYHEPASVALPRLLSPTREVSF